MLMAAGPGTTFPPYISLQEMIRGCARWAWERKRNNQSLTPKLVIYVVDHRVVNLLNSRRLDVMELLLCDNLRYWVEIIDSAGRIDRHQRASQADLPLKALLEDLGILSRKWRVFVIPPVYIGAAVECVGDILDA